MASLNRKPTSRSLFFSRNDREDWRWGDFATEPLLSPLSTSSGNKPKPNNDSIFGLWGYADDQGILLNDGRPGAQFAPKTIRRFFYRLTAPLLPQTNACIADYGDWMGTGPDLSTQIKTISPLLAQKLEEHPMITLGGGHDYGAVDGAGFIQWYQNNFSSSSLKPLIVNFDAHLDVRPWKMGLHSGTPFSWLLDHYPNDFDFVEIGTQKHCSSPHHHDWLKKKNVPIITLDFIRQVGMLPALRQIFAGTSVHQMCFISLDIDVFSQNLAPGCSQSWGAGLNYEEITSAIDWLLLNKTIHLLGIYEVSPPLDTDHKTSKLAACMMDLFIRNYWTK